MTHSLTPHEQQQVDAAVTNNCVCTEMDCVHSKSFRRGVDFALQHLLPGRMEKFAEWCDAIAVRCGQHEWTIGAGSETKRYTTAELVEKYLQYLETIKQKENVRTGK